MRRGEDGKQNMFFAGPLPLFSFKGQAHAKNYTEFSPHFVWRFYELMESTVSQSRKPSTYRPIRLMPKAIRNKLSMIVLFLWCITPTRVVNIISTG